MQDPPTNSTSFTFLYFANNYWIKVTTLSISLPRISISYFSRTIFPKVESSGKSGILI